MNYKRLLFLWLILVMFAAGARAQTYSEQIVRSFKISTKSSVDITNKYGKVNVKTWEKDSVKFIVDFRISTSDKEKLRKLKNQISFDFTSTNYYIVGKTSFVKSGGIFADVVESIIPTNNVTIDYTVFLPKNIILKIDNKFGDVYIDDFAGNLGLVLSNGNLKTNHLEGNTNILLTWADAEINQFDKGKIEASYSEIEIRKAGQLQFDTKRSVIDIDEINIADISSKSDKFEIEQITELRGDGNYTKLEIGKLTSEINFSNKYYGIKIDKISKDFKFISINSEYTDIDLIFQEGVGYNLDITHTSDVHLAYPSELSKLKTQEIDKDEKIFLTYGPVGMKATTGSPKVKINATKKCYISIFHR